MIDAIGLGWIEWEPVMESPAPHANGDGFAESLTDSTAVLAGDSTVVAFADFAKAFEFADVVEAFEDFIPESLPDWSASQVLLDELSLSLAWVEMMAEAGALTHSLFVDLRRSPALLPILGLVESTYWGNSSVSILSRVHPKNGPPASSLATGT